MELDYDYFGWSDDLGFFDLPDPFSHSTPINVFLTLRSCAQREALGVDDDYTGQGIAVDPDGAGAAPAFQTYCSGAWTWVAGIELNTATNTWAGNASQWTSNLGASSELYGPPEVPTQGKSLGWGHLVAQDIRFSADALGPGSIETTGNCLNNRTLAQFFAETFGTSFPSAAGSTPLATCSIILNVPFPADQMSPLYWAFPPTLTGPPNTIQFGARAGLSQAVISRGGDTSGLWGIGVLDEAIWGSRCGLDLRYWSSTCNPIVTYPAGFTTWASWPQSVNVWVR
jgi:hypothetical protein